MNIEERLQELKREQCPVKVDVVDSVMQQVRNLNIQSNGSTAQQSDHPAVRRISPLTRIVTWVGSLAAAAVVAILVINTLVVSPVASSDQQLGNMIASLQDYDYYGSVEEVALEPLDFFYDEL